MGPSGLVAPPPGWVKYWNVRLQSPTSPHLILINCGYDQFEAALRPRGTIEFLEIGIERARRRRYPRVGDRDAEFILGAAIAQSDEFDTGIGIEIDDITVRRAVGRTGKDANSTIDVLPNPIQLLFKHRINAVVAAQIGRHAAAGRVRKRGSVGSEPLVREVRQNAASRRP